MPRAASARAFDGPDLEVFTAVTGRGVHKAGAGVLGDVIARQERDAERIIVGERL